MISPESSPGELVIPRPIRAATSLVVLVGLAVAGGLFLVPNLFIGVGPRMLSPLTARITAGELALFTDFMLKGVL
jgi:hypothetical protein